MEMTGQVEKGKGGAGFRIPPAPRPKKGRGRLIALAITAGLVLFLVVTHLFAPLGDGRDIAIGLFVMWGVLVLGWGIRWLWRKLTYRVGVRLFISYLWIGFLPFPIFLLLLTVIGFVFVGQYGAVRIGNMLKERQDAMGSVAGLAIQELVASDSTHARGILDGARENAARDGLRVHWLLNDGTQIWRSTQAPAFDVPGWIGEGLWGGPVASPEQNYLAVFERKGEQTAALILPLDLTNARALSQGRWFGLRFVAVATKPEKDKSGGLTITVGKGKEGPRQSDSITIAGEGVSQEQVGIEWLTPSPQQGSWWRKLTIEWWRFDIPPRHWQDGAVVKDRLFTTLIKVKAAGAIDDLFTSPEKLGRDVGKAIFVTSLVFFILYLLAVSMAVVMIMSITRSTSRLTHGAREVAAGNLDFRIPVKRHDQLGDLAHTFNAMTEAVSAMIAQVAEKEHLAQEMRLAREIQQNLLADKKIEHGGLKVDAHFQPAAEVGGDYFDIFRLSPRSLLVAVGDVAGHGLSTGLLMAMLKSALGALVGEGHRGRELLERTNRLFMQQNVKQRMATLLLVGVNADTGRVELASAGHPPLYVVQQDGQVDEILLSSLPLGNGLPMEPATHTLSLPPGTKLVLYSDGLIEALNGDDEAFGYQRLRTFLNRNAELSSAELLAAILGELATFTGSLALIDDLTVVIVELPLLRSEGSS